MPSIGYAPLNASQITTARTPEAVSSVASLAGLGLVGGATVAAIAHLLRRLRQASSGDEEANIATRSPILSVQGKAPKQASLAADVPWYGPAATASVFGSSLLGYWLMQRFGNKAISFDLAREEEEAKKQFNKALQGALRPQRLKLNVKSASGEVSDMNAFLAWLDEKATEQVKQGGIIDAVKSVPWKHIGWWAALASLLPAGIGAYYGYRHSRAKNPYAKKLKQIKQWRSLQAMNTPMPAILQATPVTLSSRTQMEDEEDDES